MTTQLTALYSHEQNRRDDPWLTQPMGGGRLTELTFGEGMNEARRIAAHLESLGLPPGSRIAIFSKNTAWWFLADLAIWMAGHVSVPIYPTLAAKSIRAILEHAGVELIFIGKLDGFAQMEPGIPERLRRIVMPLGPETAGTRWTELVANTAPLSANPEPPPDRLATLMYTSGSTGEPKGVMHSFRTMCAARFFVDRFGLGPSDRAISYLPLSHTAERAVLETTNFLAGFHVFFAESLDTFVRDVQRARPTVFGSVPRLWVKFQAGVFEKLPPRKLARLLKLPLIGTLVRTKILKGLGLDQVRVAVTGSAPLSPELVGWYRDLGLAMHEIYAMTENFALSHLMEPSTWRPGYVGFPVTGVEARLGEGGEVLIKSPGMMLGYYRAPETTAAAIDSEGWLHTGDRGELAADGQLRITGRLKEVFKTSKGKYVAPAPIENLLMGSSLFDQICVSGANMAQPYALAVLSPAHRNAGTDALEEALARVNRQLDPHEQLERLVIIDEEWTVENGLLTPTMKIKRAALEEKYSARAEGWYRSPGPVLRA